MNDSPKERIIHFLLAACAWSAVISLGVITVFIFQAGLPLIAKVGIPNFLFNAVWDPTAKTPWSKFVPHAPVKTPDLYNWNSR